MNKDICKKLLALGFIILAAWYSLWMIQPPAPKPTTAPADTFSAERAFNHIREIGQRPHPLGSEENGRVRNYILSELREIGVQPTLQQGIALKRESALAGNVKNILVKIPGSNPTKTIMLMAHYDSVPNGPGAADDGLGVASILETLRALQARDQLKNNLWVLFTDGEERGLLGAEYFIQASDDWKELDLVMNIEARGTNGSSIMFETSSGNENLISHFAAASGSPVANSLSYTVYKLIPNDTDLSVFKRAGVNGLNFANIEGVLNYHTAQDLPENVSTATLQDHGQNVLSNTLYFGNTNFKAEGSSDAVYFNGLTGNIIWYPASWSFPIAAAGALILLIYLVILFRRKTTIPGKYLLGILSFVLISGLAVLFTYGGWQLMRELHPSYDWIAHRESYAFKWYLWGFSAMTLGLSIAGFRWLQSKVGLQNLMAGIVTLVMILSLLIAWYLPTASYLLTWPALFALAGWMIAESPAGKPKWKNVIVLFLAIFPAVFILTPYISLIQITLSTLALGASMFLLLIMIGLGWPLLHLITENRGAYWSGALLIIFLLCMAGASLNSGFDEDHKKHNSIIYAQDLDTQESLWLSSDHSTDKWTRQFLGENPERDFYFEYSPYWNYRFLQAPAPSKEIQAPEVEILKDSTANNLRHLSLRVTSPYGGLTARFMLASGDNFEKVSIFDRHMFDAAAPLPNQRYEFNQFYYFGDLTKPVDLSIAIPSNETDAALDVQIISKKWPVGLMQKYKPRADYMMPIPFGISDAVIFKKSYPLNTVEE
jgi:hypothetical protein